MEAINKLSRLEPNDQGALVAVGAAVIATGAALYGTSRVVHEATRRAFPEGGPKEVLARVAGTVALVWLAADAVESYPAPAPFTTATWVAERLGINPLAPKQ